MSWAAKVRDILGGEEGSKRRLNAALVEIYEGFAARRARLLADAALAPTEASATNLRALADDLAAAAAQLRPALEERGVTVRRAAPPAAASSGASHWARVVADMEAERAARDQILEYGARFADDDPGAAALLEALVEHLDHSCSWLRREIARADPQALN